MEKTSGSAWRICGFFNMPRVYIYIRTLCHNFAEIYVPVSDLIKKTRGFSVLVRFMCGFRFLMGPHVRPNFEKCIRGVL